MEEKREVYFNYLSAKTDDTRTKHKQICAKKSVLKAKWESWEKYVSNFELQYKKAK